MGEEGELTICVVCVRGWEVLVDTLYSKEMRGMKGVVIVGGGGVSIFG